MTIAGSIILIVVGAILRFAVTWTASGIDIHVVGDILMAGGVPDITLILMYTRRSPGAARASRLPRCTRSAATPTATRPPVLTGPC